MPVITFYLVFVLAALPLVFLLIVFAHFVPVS